MTDRPAIPGVIKRTVRKRCGFGCVICGVPIYEYEHMRGWAEVQRHVADEITLLCPTHHAARNKGLLSVADVVDSDKRPFNRQRHHTAGFKLLFRSSPRVVLGEQTFRCKDDRRPTYLIPILIHGTAPLGFTIGQDDAVLLNLEALDSAGEPIVRIRDSELLVGTGVFDAEMVGRRLTVHTAAREIAFDMVFEPPRTILIERYHVFTKGIAVDVAQKKIALSGRRTTNFTLTGTGEIIANIGVLAGDCPPGLTAALRIE